MRSRTTVLSLVVLLHALPSAAQPLPGDDVVGAKTAVVQAALSVRKVRLEVERAAAALDAARTALEAARREAPQAPTTAAESRDSVAVAAQLWRQALGVLEHEGALLGQAEEELAAAAVHLDAVESQRVRK